TINGQNNSRLFDITSTSGNFTFKGLTLTGGKTTDSSGNGGAVRSTSTDQLTVLNCAIVGNSITGSLANGAGIFSSGSVGIASSTISGNAAVNGGGGIFAFGSISVSNSTVSGNTAANGGGISGFGSVSVTSSTITGNQVNGASGDGGG